MYFIILVRNRVFKEREQNRNRKIHHILLFFQDNAIFITNRFLFLQVFIDRFTNKLTDFRCTEQAASDWNNCPVSYSVSRENTSCIFDPGETFKPLKRQTKIAADDILNFYFSLSKKIRLDFFM